MEHQNWKQRMISYINALANEKLTIGISEKIIQGIQSTITARGLPKKKLKICLPGIAVEPTLRKSRRAPAWGL